MIDERIFFSLCAERDEAQPRLFSNGAPVDVENMLLEMIRPAEVLAAEGAGEGIPGAEAAALVSGMACQRRSRSVPTSAHYAPKWQFTTQDDLLRGAGCKHTGGGLLHHTGSCTKRAPLISAKPRDTSVETWTLWTPPLPHFSFSFSTVERKARTKRYRQYWIKLAPKEDCAKSSQTQVARFAFNFFVNESIKLLTNLISYITFYSYYNILQ